MCIDLEDWPYTFDPAQPLNLEIIQQAVQVTLETDAWQSLESNKGLKKYVMRLNRVSSWLPAEAKESLEILFDAWTEHENAYVQKLLESGQAEKSEKHKKTMENTLMGMDRVESWLSDANSNQKGEDRERQLSIQKESSLTKPKDASEEQVNDEPVSVDSTPLLEVDESILPFSAWPLYRDPLFMVRAATHYLEKFQDLNKTLEQEPILQQARLQALTLVAEGSQRKATVGLQFLTVWTEQERIERIANNIRKETAIEEDSPENGKHG